MAKDSAAFTKHCMLNGEYRAEVTSAEMAGVGLWEL